MRYRFLGKINKLITLCERVLILYFTHKWRCSYLKRKFPVSKRLAVYSIIFFVLYVYCICNIGITERANGNHHIFSPVGVDYSMLYAAGTTAVAGDAKEVYDIPQQQEMMTGYLHIDKIPDDVLWSYPPTTLLFVMTAFSMLSFYVSLILWLSTTLAFAVFAVCKILINYKELSLLALGYPPVMYNFRWGQNVFLVRHY